MAAVIEYLREENRVLKQQLGRKRTEFASLVTPDTILRWHRQLIAENEIWGSRGLVTFYVFFVIELATRRIEIAGITPGPNAARMMQIGRNLTDPIGGFLAEKEFLILDRDSKYSAAFRDLLKDSAIAVVQLPPRSLPSSRSVERLTRRSLPSASVGPVSGQYELSARSKAQSRMQRRTR